MNNLSVPRTLMCLFLIVGCLLSGALAKPTKSPFPKEKLITPADAIGTSFMLSPIQIPNNLNATAHLFIVNKSPINNTVTITTFGALSFSNKLVDFVVINLPPSVPIPSRNGISHDVIQIMATFPVSVELLINDMTTNDSEGTIVYPTTSLGTKYLVNTVPLYHGVSIVVANNNTQVNIIFPNGIVSTQTLALFDVWHLQGNTLVGSIIKSTNLSNPIGVFTSRNCLVKTADLCNYMLEAVPPASAFGQDFIYVQPPVVTAKGNDAMYALFRFMSDQDYTKITFNNDIFFQLGKAGMVQSYLYTGPSATIHSNSTMDIELINGYRYPGYKTQLSMVSNDRFAKNALFSILNHTSYNFLIVIAPTADIDPTGFKFNNVTQILTYKPTVNPDYSSVTLVLNNSVTFYRVSSTYSFVGYYYASTKFESIYASPINRNLST